MKHVHSSEWFGKTFYYHQANHNCMVYMQPFCVSVWHYSLSCILWGKLVFFANIHSHNVFIKGKARHLNSLAKCLHWWYFLNTALYTQNIKRHHKCAGQLGWNCHSKPQFSVRPLQLGYPMAVNPKRKLHFKWNSALPIFQPLVISRRMVLRSK